ncbi:hypothetical protein [Parasphingorhabdus pacifica]
MTQALPMAPSITPPLWNTSGPVTTRAEALGASSISSSGSHSACGLQVVAAGDHLHSATAFEQRGQRLGQFLDSCGSAPIR